MQRKAPPMPIVEEVQEVKRYKEEVKSEEEGPGKEEAKGADEITVINNRAPEI